MSRQHVFEKSTKVEYWIDPVGYNFKGWGDRPGIVMSDDGTDTVEVMDKVSAFRFHVPAGHVWDEQGIPGDDPVVSISWSDDGLHIVCTREQCMVNVPVMRDAYTKAWWTQEIPGNHVVPEHARWLINEHLKTHVSDYEKQHPNS